GALHGRAPPATRPRANPGARGARLGTIRTLASDAAPRRRSEDARLPQRPDPRTARRGGLGATRPVRSAAAEGHRGPDSRARVPLGAAVLERRRGVEVVGGAAQHTAPSKLEA